MAHRAAFGIAAAFIFALGGCAAGSRAPVPYVAAADAVETVSDAADAMTGQRVTSSARAGAAISATNLLGSAMRSFPSIAQALTDGASGRLSNMTGSSVVAGSEALIRPNYGRESGFCQDSAGYNRKGIPSLDTTFGWQSGVLANAGADERGSLTWSATIGGTAYEGSIGSLALATGHRNTDCPVSMPAYTVRGGAPVGDFSIPVTVTYLGNQLRGLTVSHAALPDGWTLSVATKHDRRGNLAIDGTFTQISAHIAAFHVDARGNGTLTIESNGAQYRIDDWLVSGT